MVKYVSAFLLSKVCFLNIYFWTRLKHIEMLQSSLRFSLGCKIFYCERVGLLIGLFTYYTQVLITTLKNYSTGPIFTKHFCYFWSKADYLSLAVLFSLIQCFWVCPEPTQVEHIWNGEPEVGSCPYQQLS
jgi:hypothetical protein